MIDSGDAEQVVDRAADHDVAAVLAGVRADVDDPVGGPDGVLVVLDDDQGVAEVLEPDQRLDQAVVVALVQPDRRLVQDVEHPDESGADLGREPDALRLAAGQRRGRAVEREVVQPDVDQEAEPGVDLLEHPLADELLARRRGRAACSQLGRLADRQRATARRSSGRATVTARISGLSRVPWQVGHGTSRMKPSYFSRE